MAEGRSAQTEVGGAGGASSPRFAADTIEGCEAMGSRGGDRGMGLVVVVVVVAGVDGNGGQVNACCWSICTVIQSLGESWQGSLAWDFLCAHPR